MKNKSIIEELGITPGPWKIDKRTHPCDGEYTSIGPLVPDDEMQAYNPYIECTGADAAIVVAAPEMLEALIGTALDLEFRASVQDGFGAMKDRYEQIISVIEKAVCKGDNTNSGPESWDEIKELL